MKVAIDKNCVNKIKDFSEFDFIYVFDNEPLEKLIKLNLHCMSKNHIENVEVNLTEHNINCLKKCNIDDKEWKKPIEKKDYKFAIIVPNCNNDHRRI